MKNAPRRVAEWIEETVDGRAAYDVLATVVAAEPLTALQTARGSRVPSRVWSRVLALEGCAAWLEGVQRGRPAVVEALAPAAPLIRAASAQALRNAVAAVQQLEEIAAVAARADIRVMALKGAARVLAGETPESRVMADIDLLVSGDDADRLHQALQRELHYTPAEPGTPERHLPSLVRTGSLPVEVHRRLGDTASAIDRRAWVGTRRVRLGAAEMELPDATALFMHALDHAVVVHSAARFRLRDVLDVATLAVGGVNQAEVASYLQGHPERLAAEAILVAASSLRPEVAAAATAGMRRRAWQRIRRVGRARLLAPARPDLPATLDPRVLVLSQLAQGSPRAVLRLAMRALSSPGRALGLASGRWLPVEAEQARAVSDSMAPVMAPVMTSAARPR